MFYYYDAGYPFLDTDASCHVAMVPAGLDDLRTLLGVLGQALHFPSYYGKNLDAFWDCVTDLENIRPHRVVVAHRDLPPLPNEELAGYIEVLRDAVHYWDRPKAEHHFEVWFPLGARKRIQNLPGALPAGNGLS